jgi:hypothetical protein
MLFTFLQLHYYLFIFDTMKDIYDKCVVYSNKYLDSGFQCIVT